MPLEEVTPLEKVVVPRQILLVEDEELPRDSLARMLESRGYSVLLANSGPSAIRKAKSEALGLVLMDIVLGDGMDGIDAAEKIQSVQPETPFIFVTAFANEPGYRERVQSSQIREGGWLEKPISIKMLEERIENELQKRKILAWLDEVQDFGLDPYEQLDSLKYSLPAAMVYDLRRALEAEDELYASDDIRPLKGQSEEERLMQISSEIEAVYDEIIHMLTEQQGRPDLESAVAPLRDKLEDLQELQADAMERHFRSQLQYDPVQGRRIISRAKKILGKR